MTEGSLDTPDDLNRLAAEFALSLLDGDERKRAQERYDRDASFRASVDAWREQFVGFVDELPPRPPSPETWSAIASRLGPSLQDRRQAAGDGWWNSVRLWRRLALAGLSAAAAMLAVVVLPPPDGGPGKDRPVQPQTASAVSLGAALLPKDGPALFIVTYQQGSDRLVTVPTGRPVPDTGRYVLWLVHDDDDPVALGDIEQVRVSQVTIPAGRATLLTVGAILVVTREPAGSPPGPAAPGPVLAKGTLELASL